MTMSADISLDRTVEQLYRDIERMKAENESLKGAVEILREAVPEPATCGWSEWSSSGEYWETECGQDFSFIEGTPSSTGMKFCPFCGKPIAELPYAGDPEEEAE